MLEIKKIVVAVDFSDDSALAFQHACLIAKEFNAELHLIHSCGSYGQEFSDYSVQYLKTLQQPILPSLKKLAEKEIESFLKKFPDQNLKVKKEIKEAGPIVQQILEYSDQIHADLLVMGSHGKSKMDRVLLGSVADRILKRAKCSTLLVHNRESLNKFTNQDLYKKIFIGTDFSKCSEAAVSNGLQLAKRLNAEVDIVHVVDTDLFLPLKPLAVRTVLDEFQAEMVKEARQKMDRYLDSFTNAKDFLGLHVLAGKPSREILSACKQFKSDLLILGTHGTSKVSDWFLGTTALRIVEHAPCAVLVMK